MRSKHYDNTPMSWLRQLAREIGVVSVLSISLIGNAYGGNDNGKGNDGHNNGNQYGQNHNNGGGQNAVPEIATGAAISAFLLAGGSLLLLSDRIRKKNSTSS